MHYNKREMQPESKIFFRLFIMRRFKRIDNEMAYRKLSSYAQKSASFYMLHFCNLFLNYFLGRLINHDNKTNAYLIPISFTQIVMQSRISLNFSPVSSTRECRQSSRDTPSIAAKKLLLGWLMAQYSESLKWKNSAKNS